MGKEKLNELYQTKRIVIAAGSVSSGVSFISELLAIGLTKLGSVSLTELGKGHFYDSLGFEKHFLESGYIDFFQKIRQNERINPDQKNIYKEVNWIAKVPFDNLALSVPEIYRLFYQSKEEYSVFDCSRLSPDITLPLLAEADYPIVVIDPLPSKLSESRQFLENIRISLPNTVFIVNKMNNGVHFSELSHFLGIKKFYSVSSVPNEYIYKAEYNSISVMQLKEAYDYLSQTQDMLSKLFQ